MWSEAQPSDSRAFFFLDAHERPTANHADPGRGAAPLLFDVSDIVTLLKESEAEKRPCMTMSDNPQCYECGEQIDGDVVWWRPFGGILQEDSRTWQFIAKASTERMENSRPLHPACFEKQTGEKWPPDSK